MDSNSKSFKNYSPEEVDHFLEQIIMQVERMIEDNKAKNREIALRDAKIEELTKLVKTTAHMQDKLAQYERMEGTLNRAIIMAEKTSEQIKLSAHHESETIINDARRNANRIVNDALLRAEKTEMEANLLKRNVTIFKRRLKEIVEAQLEMVNDIEKVEF